MINLLEQVPHALPVLLWLGAYLIGSVSFGYLLLRITGHGDIRTLGSKGTGATNALRIAGLGVAAGVFLGDFLKAALPVFLVKFHWGENLAILAASGIFIGHLFPCWLRFRGGKAIASLIGILLVLEWRLWLIFCHCWLLTATFSRYSSVSSLLAVTLLPVFALLLQAKTLLVPGLIAALLVYHAHRRNIRRLLRGEEPTILDKI